MADKTKYLSVILILIFFAGIISDSALCIAAGEVDLRKARASDYWDLTRKSTAVVVGIVTMVDGNVSMSVDRILKGKDVTETVVFPHPPVSKNPKGVMFSPPSRIVRFAAGGSWLVFLQANKPSSYYLLEAVTKDMQQNVERTVRDVMALDSLKDDTAKCKMLISLACPYKQFSKFALRELDQYNRPEFLELFAPLEEYPLTKRHYIRLLEINSNPKATDILLGFLKAEDKSLLQETIYALGRRETKSTEISKTLLQYLSHNDPKIRMSAVSVLRGRGYRDAIPEIVKCLDDPDPAVRCYALHWPWYSYVGEHQEVVPKIRELARDSNEHVRESACRTLLSIRDLPSFYFLWSRCLFDKSVQVRKTIDLSLLLEHRPVVIGAILLWPTIVMAVTFLFITKYLRLKKQIMIMVIGLVVGYLVGVGSGYLVGTYHAAGSFMQAVLLMPSMCIPLSLIVAAVIYAPWKRLRIHRHPQ